MIEVNKWMKLKRKIIILFLLIFIFTNTIFVNAKPLLEKKGHVDNNPPSITLSAKKKPVDIVIITDYTGAKLVNLQTEISNLESRLYNQNVDPVFHIVNDMKKVGTQNDGIYKWKRYGRYKYLSGQYDVYSRYDNYTYYDVWFEDTVLWEEVEALESEYSNLPKRNPTNVTFTRGPLQYDFGDTRYLEYYDVTIRVSNDIKSSGTTTVTVKQIWNMTGTGFEKDRIPKSESASVDSKWSKGEKVRDVIRDIYSINFDNLNTIPLRPKSDRHMLFISDSASKNYGNSQGNYFCFGDITDTLKSYIDNNNFQLYGIVPNDAKDMRLSVERAVDIVTVGTTTLFTMKNGETWQLGNYSLYNDYPGNKESMIVYPETVDTKIGKIKDRVWRYLLTKDNKAIYFDRDINKFNTIQTNVKKIYKCESSYSNYFLIKNDGNIYSHLPSNNTQNRVPFNKPVKDMVFAGQYSSYPIYLTTDGELYYVHYDPYKNTITTQEKIYHYNSSTGTISNLPPVDSIIKQNTLFESGGRTRSMYLLTILYTNGAVQQFYGNVVTRDNTSCLINTGSIIANNVRSIESAENCSFLYQNNGAVRYLSANIVTRTGYDKDDDPYTYLLPEPATTTKSVPINNVAKTYYAGNYQYYMVDSGNNVYLYNGKKITNNTSITLRNIGQMEVDYFLSNFDFNVSNGVSSTYKNVYIKNNDGTVRINRFRSNDFGSGDHYLYYDYVLSTPNNKKIRDIATETIEYSWTHKEYVLYLLTEDGEVYGTGNSEYGQLGRLTSTTSYIKPFYNMNSYNQSKRYYSLLELFRDSPYNKFYPTGQYASAFNDIYKLYENLSGLGSITILLDEEIEYISGEYQDYENDPEYQRKWTINHNPNYFDNSMGLSAYHNPTGFITNPPSKLDKVGRYIINLKVMDNPKQDNRFDNYRKWSTGDQNLTVYVHRKPIALMDVSVTKNANDTFKIIATDGGSYDLDHASRADKGIVEWQWAWRDQWEDSWHYERMNKSDATGDRAYIIALRVKDMEGSWSDWVYQTIDRRQPPIAKFEIIKNPITSLELAQIKDTSYAIMSNLTNWHWIVKRVNDNGSIGAILQEVKPTSSNTGAGGYDTSLNLTRINPGVGKYRIYLRVKADNGLWSDGGTDATPNINNMFYRDLTVNQALSIEDISITGRWNHFRGWTDKFGVYKDVMKDTTYVDEKGVSRYPYRFMSYEMIDITVKLEGYADKVIIDFPDGLGSMNYTDKLGYSYSYLEDVGYTVSFPYEIAINPTLKDPIITWSYILPLVNSSASWENVRARQPYTISIKAIKGTYEITQTKKIDITGNVDDLIFIQPVER